MDVEVPGDDSVWVFSLERVQAIANSIEYGHVCVHCRARTICSTNYYRRSSTQFDSKPDQLLVGNISVQLPYGKRVSNPDSYTTTVAVTVLADWLEVSGDSDIGHWDIGRQLCFRDDRKIWSMNIYGMTELPKLAHQAKCIGEEKS